MYKYGNLQSPSALYPLCPEAKIVVSHPSDESIIRLPIPAIIDTGAVMTVVPGEIIQELARISPLYPFGKKSFRMANDQSGELLTYLIYLRVIDTTNQIDFQGEIEVVSIPSKEYAAIGRDILNQNKVVFNAPRQKWGFNCDEEDCALS